MSIKLLRVSLLALAILSAPAMADNREEAVKAMDCLLYTSPSPRD